MEACQTQPCRLSEAGPCFGDQQQAYLLKVCQLVLVSSYLMLRGHGAVLCMCALAVVVRQFHSASAENCVLVVESDEVTAVLLC
jgi:hypothetical protein